MERFSLLLCTGIGCRGELKHWVYPCLVADISFIELGGVCESRQDMPREAVFIDRSMIIRVEVRG